MDGEHFYCTGMVEKGNGKVLVKKTVDGVVRDGRQG